MALSLLQKIDSHHRDKPLGLDSDVSDADKIFVSGVFSQTAVMVLLEDFVHLVPVNFSIYKLAKNKDDASDAKLFYPKTGFSDDNSAVVITLMASQKLAAAHEAFARTRNRMK